MKDTQVNCDAEVFAQLIAAQHAELLARPALQKLYSIWAGRIGDFLSPIPGTSVELGCGCNALDLPLLKTDFCSHEWAQEIVDACRMPFQDNACANLVAVDVLHHLPDVTAFFNECRRVLADKGRLIILEPYISTFSKLIFRFHHEPADMSICPFRPIELRDSRYGNIANQAMATLVFKKHLAEFQLRWPELSLVTTEFSDILAWPLTGGFSKPSLIPAWLVGPLKKAEQAIIKLAGATAAMRILIVIEKKS